VLVARVESSVPVVPRVSLPLRLVLVSLVEADVLLVPTVERLPDVAEVSSSSGPPGPLFGASRVR